ncbi:MAG: hypothetical protein QW400_04340 [Candidatus Diapherotrites archaeon]
MRKLILSRAILISIATIFFVANLHSRMLVDIVPQGDLPQKGLYIDEIRQYEIRIMNLGDSEIKNPVLKVGTSGNLVLVENLGEKTELIEELDPLAPKAIKKIYVKLKPVEKIKAGQRENLLNVYYGDGEYENYAGMRLFIADSPIEVKASLKKQVMGKGEDNRLDLEIKNKSNGEVLEDISLSIEISEGLEIKEKQQKISPIGVGELVRKSFYFSSLPESLGQQKISATISFKDSSGTHLLEKNLVVEVQDVGFDVLVMTTIILLIIIVYIAMKRKSSIKIVDDSAKTKIKEQNAQ